MDYPITTLSAAVLGLWLIVLSWRVITARQNNEKTGEKDILERRIRGQANLTEYAPMALILMFLAEHGGAATWWVAVLAGIFEVGKDRLFVWGIRESLHDFHRVDLICVIGFSKVSDPDRIPFMEQKHRNAVC